VSAGRPRPPVSAGSAEVPQSEPTPSHRIGVLRRQLERGSDLLDVGRGEGRRGGEGYGENEGAQVHGRLQLEAVRGG
jgi:hypothetical protein